MTIFAIIPQTGPNSQNLKKAIETNFSARYELDENHGWLVSDTGTAKEIAEKMKISGGENGAALVVEVASYFGRANPNIWTWIKSNWEKPNG